MSIIEPVDRTRRVLPRWRSHDDARDPHRPPPVDVVRPDLIALETEWTAQEEHTRGVGLDLVSTATSAATPSIAAIDAARWLDAQGGLGPLARRAVERVLHVSSAQLTFDGPPDDPDERVAIHERIKRLRARTNADPRDALAWADRARMHTLIGQDKPAERAMDRALALAPQHRFLLRAASRMWVHQDDPERAHELLKGADGLTTDPWLLASEISVAPLNHRMSSQIKHARLLVRSGRWSDRDLTELASALGTIELENGARKSARDLFRAALRDPNDNSTAQAEWAVPNLPTIAADLAPMIAQTSGSFEARAIAAQNAARHEEAVEQCWYWLADQPFTSEPAITGSYQAALTGDFERSHEFARRGLLANRTDPTLLNNAGFALAKLDRTEEAIGILSNINEAMWSDDERSVLLATRGLIAFRTGFPTEGQRMYARAMEDVADPRRQFLMALMLLTEMARLDPAAVREQIVAMAATARRMLPPDSRAWVGHLTPYLPTDARPRRR